MRTVAESDGVKNILSRAGLWLLAWLLLAGCAHRPPPSMDYGLILERSYQRFLDSRSPFQARGRLQVTAPSFSRQLDFSLCWESSTRFRIDITGPLGIRLASAALADSTTWIWAPLIGIDILGRTDGLDSFSLNRLGLAVQEIMAFIEGWPLMTQEHNPPALPKKGSIVYNFARGDTTILLELDRLHGMPLRFKIAHHCQVLWEAEFSEQQSFGPGFRPRRLSLRAPSQEISLEMELNPIRRSQPFPAETWSPPGRKTAD